MSIFSSYKKIFLLGFIIVLLVAIPFSIYVARTRQHTTIKASASTTLTFDPLSSTIAVGDTVSLDVTLDPGTGSTANQVSYTKLSIKFDPAKLTTVDNSLAHVTSAQNTLTTVLEGPVYDNTAGKASISLSIGADPTKVLMVKTKIATLKLKALAPTDNGTPTKIEFVIADKQIDTQVLSIASSDQTSENVLSTTAPASVIITGASTSITPTAATATPPASSSITPSASINKIPVCSSLNIDRSASGSAPYSLTFTVAGSDSDGTIKNVSVNFGDGPVKVITSEGGIGTNSINSQISHTYNNLGTYIAYAILTDNNDGLSVQQDACKKTITVNAPQAGAETGATATPTPTPTPTSTPTPEVLPPTGPGQTILGVGIIGTIITLVGGILFISL